MRGLSCERQFGSRAIELRPPLNELRNVFRTFFNQQRDGLRAAQSISRVDGVLFMQSDFVFVGKRNGDSALCPGGCRIAQVRFGQHQHAPRRAQLDGRTQSGDSAAHNGIVGVIRLVGIRHRSGESFASLS